MDKNKQGIIAAQSGDLKTAQILFMEAFAETPNNEGLFLNVARSMSMQRKHQELLSYFDCEFTEKGRQLKEPNSAIIMAQSAIEVGMEGIAIAILEEIQKKTDNISIAIMLSEQLIKTNQLEKCQSVLTKILRKTKNEDPSLITNLAITESELGNYKTAEELYKQVIEIRPNEFLGFYNIANFMHETGNIDSAKAYLARAESIVANTPEARKLKDAIADSQGEESTKMAKIYRLIENEKWDNAKDLLMKYREKADQNKWMAAACELPKKQQEHLGVEIRCRPSLIVKQIQLINENDNMINILTQIIKSNASLAWNRAGKPTTGGYQTHEIFRNTHEKAMKELTSMIKQNIASNDELNTNAQEAEVSGWGVVLKSGGFQKKHTHTESKASGVLYLKAPKLDQNKTGFDGNIRFIGSSDLTLTPYPGLMLLFPSYLPHETIPFACNEERICLAFNIL